MRETAPRREPLTASAVLFVSGPVNVVGLAGGHGTLSGSVRYASHSPFAHCCFVSHAMPAIDARIVVRHAVDLERGEREALAERAVERRVRRAEEPSSGPVVRAVASSRLHEIVLGAGPAEVPRVLPVGDAPP